VWMTLSVYGADRIGAIAQQTCDLAQTLAARVDREPALQRLAPVALNIVCFRYIAANSDLDRLNADIVADLQEAGIAAPSTTMVGGVLAIRAAIVNHRTNYADIRFWWMPCWRLAASVGLKRKCPRLFTGGKYTGRLHVWETQGPVAPFQRLALELWQRCCRNW
jgi:glutamate/tyrosine decarboxylase-like PLP-dependent enzyme